MTWEADTDQALQVGMRRSFHADDERTVILPHDTIEKVSSPEEWQQDSRMYDFVKGNHQSLLRLIELHYGTLKAPWSQDEEKSEKTFVEKIAELKEFGYESRYTRTQGCDDDCFWICPIDQYPEGVIALDEDQAAAVDEALEILRNEKK